MQTIPAEDLRYPIGKPEFPAKLSFPERERMIGEIEQAPARLRAAVGGLSDARLDTAYREGGWTVRQVVHHLADSHQSGCARFRVGLAENGAGIAAINPQRWAELSDARTAPIEPSLAILDGLHQRWTLLLRSMQAADFERTVQHPQRGSMTLDSNLALFAWHGRHHVAHITSLCERMGWR